MEREYEIRRTESKIDYTSRNNTLSEEDRMMAEVYLPLVRMIPVGKSWDEPREWN